MIICGAGGINVVAGLALTGGAGFHTTPWSSLRLVFGVGAGCGLGVGFGYGFGLGARLDRRVRQPRREEPKRFVLEL
eukprot:SM000117S25539  [mRNA]  locus=s117:434777:435007:- [translate_table: standard]